MSDNLPDKPLLTLAERLKWWRIKRGFKSRQALATASGVSNGSIGDLESGRQKTTTRITELAAALKINPHYLKTGQGNPLDLTASPAPRSVNQILVELISAEEVADLTETEMQLLQFRFREAIADVKKLRPKRRLQKTG